LSFGVLKLSHRQRAERRLTKRLADTRLDERRPGEIWVREHRRRARARKAHDLLKVADDAALGDVQAWLAQHPEQP
jgi:hypothetical protein